MAKVVHDYLASHELAADLVELTPKERIAAVTRLLPYVLAPQRHEDGPDVAVEQMVAKLLEHAQI